METRTTIFQMIGAVVGVFVLLLICAGLATGFNIITLPWLKLNRQVQFNQDVITKTYEVEYCLNNYEWFKQQKQDIDGMAEKIVNAKKAAEDFRKNAGPRENWTFEDKTEDARLQSNVTGLENRRVDLIKTYNARSEQLNRIACRELPLFINL